MSTVVRTTVPVSSHQFEWIIDNFDAIFPPYRVTDCIKLDWPRFDLRLHDGALTKWSVWFLVDNNKKLFVRIELKQYTPSEGSLPGIPRDGLVCYIGVSPGWDSNTTWTRRKACIKSQQSDEPVFELFTANELHLRKAELLRNGALRLQFKVDVLGNSKTSTRKTLGMGLTERTLEETYHRNISTLLHEHRALSDLEIMCGSESFAVHKLILIVRSQVFKAMFASDMLESTTNAVEVDDIEPEHFRIILAYIYTGKVGGIEADSLFPVIHGAEKYGLEELKNYCFQRAADCLTDDMVGTVAVAAHMYNAREEIKEAVRLYLESKLTMLLKNPVFKKLFLLHPTAFY